ncbi:MAG: hypothetical protein LC792_22420 [Actinobacteria bacterium]|nr:hypothetical protein [Actinomycetota bacterium]
MSDFPRRVLDPRRHRHFAWDADRRRYVCTERDCDATFRTITDAERHTVAATRGELHRDQR